MTTSAFISSQKRSTHTPNLKVFVVQLHDGRIVVGTAANPSQAITALNSGIHKGFKELCVNNIIGIKPVTDERNAVTVFKRMAEHYGFERVVAV